MKDSHFRFLPSTRKLRARLKAEINAVARSARKVSNFMRTPLEHRPAAGSPFAYSSAYPASIAAQATILCATLAHMRGRVHAGRWDAAGQVKFIHEQLPKVALAAHVKAMIASALDVPAREKARRLDHEERLAHRRLHERAGAA